MLHQQNMIKVLHLDSEKTWRGGENQMALFIKGSALEAQSFLASPPDSVASKKLIGIAKIIPAKFNFPQIISTARQLANFCRQEDINIIDCQSSKAHNLGLLIKFFYPSLALIVHRRVDFKPGDGYFNKRKYLSSTIDKYIPISKAISEILLDYGIPPTRITTVRSATDDTSFRELDAAICRQKLAVELQINPNIPLLINVAYHTPQKGIPTLIHALGKLRDQGVPFICLLAGDGELHESLKTLAQSLALTKDQVKFLGIRKDTHFLLSAADIFAFPSNFEGLGTSILDAIHGGCAVAASNVGGIPEIILHQHTGLLSPVGDSDTLCQNLKLLIENRNLREKLVFQAKKHIKEEFSVESMVASNLAVYRSVLKPNPTRK